MPKPNVTHILQAINGGDRHSADRLLEIIYDELRLLADARLAQSVLAIRFRLPRSCMGGTFELSDGTEIAINDGPTVWVGPVEIGPRDAKS